MLFDVDILVDSSPLLTSSTQTCFNVGILVDENGPSTEDPSAEFPDGVRIRF